MNLNNKNIYIPLIAVSTSLIAIWILFQNEFIKLISQLSSIGTVIIAFNALREYRNKVVNKVNEKQLDTVIELIKYIRDFRYFEST